LSLIIIFSLIEAAAFVEIGTASLSLRLCVNAEAQRRQDAKPDGLLSGIPSILHFEFFLFNSPAPFRVVRIFRGLLPVILHSEFLVAPWLSATADAFRISPGPITRFYPTLPDFTRFDANFHAA
jgi:hypothetical protein